MTSRPLANGINGVSTGAPDNGPVVNGLQDDEGDDGRTSGQEEDSRDDADDERSAASSRDEAEPEPEPEPEPEEEESSSDDANFSPFRIRPNAFGRASLLPLRRPPPRLRRRTRAEFEDDNEEQQGDQGQRFSTVTQQGRRVRPRRAESSDEEEEETEEEEEAEEEEEEEPESDDSDEYDPEEDEDDSGDEGGRGDHGTGQRGGVGGGTGNAPRGANGRRSSRSRPHLANGTSSQHQDTGGVRANRRGLVSLPSRAVPRSETTAGRGVDDDEDEETMADPFEIRMRFSKQLQHLNASTNAAQKCAQYAIKHKMFDEDLHSCILEQLEQTSQSGNMNNRANIMYFLEHFVSLARREGQLNYIRMIQRDIIRIVDAVAPDDGTGAANIKVVRKVLRALNTKGFLLAETVQDIEAALDDRDAKDFVLTSPTREEVSGDVSQHSATPKNGAPPATTPAAAAASALPPPLPPAFPATLARNGSITGTASVGGRRPDTRQIEQRIEEDRERHKRQRETMWAVPTGGPDDVSEATKVWDETSDWGSDDDRMAREEQEERRHQWAFECEHFAAEGHLPDDDIPMKDN